MVPDGLAQAAQYRTSPARLPPTVRRLHLKAAGRIAPHAQTRISIKVRLSMIKATHWLPLLVCAMALTMSACEKKGPMEKAGEKVDHAADTIKNGGSEPLSDKAQDEAAKARDTVNDAAGRC